VVVGELAVLLHGLDRLTADVDIVIDLETEAARSAIGALTAAGYKALAPVDPMAFADERQRESWRTERGMQVFSLWDPGNTRPTVDLFVQSPIPFETLFRDSVRLDVGGVDCRIASVGHLIEMKRAAGRPQDLVDIERLQARPRSS
jgi:hypothetical protein